jgi:benzoate membrane transport protein
MGHHPTSLRTDLGRDELANGLIGFLFSCTGPVAVILAVGHSAGLSAPVIASWVTGVFLLNGLLTIVASLRTRQPLCFFWTIPGTVVVGQAMATGTTWAEVVGGYLMAAVIMLLLALTGQVERLMRLMPMPVVMAMVAGVFLHFGTDLVLAVDSEVALAGPMVLAYVAAVALPRVAPTVAQWCPPVLAALVVGAVVVGMGVGAGEGAGVEVAGRWLAAPVWQAPVFSAPVLVELAIPLVITVVVVQNGQGMAVLRAAGHQPPMNLVTFACGALSVLAAPFGSVSTCLAGPTNALVTHSGARQRHYAAAAWCGLLAIVFGLLAPGMVRVITTMPEAFIAVLGGLAMLQALRGAFATAFSGPFGTGALVTFLVTVADITVLNIGSAFWGLVAGLVVAAVVDPERVVERRRAGEVPRTTEAGPSEEDPAETSDDAEVSPASAR